MAEYIITVRLSDTGSPLLQHLIAELTGNG